MIIILCCFQVAFDHLYNPGAAADQCTLFSDRNLINRRNVVEDVKKKFSACKQFFNLEIEARVVAAALNILGIHSMEEAPNEELLPELVKEGPIATQKIFLKDLSMRIVDKFILHEDKVNAIISDLEKDKGNSEILPTGRFPCRYPGCSKSFVRDGKSRISHERTHGLHADTSQSTLLDTGTSRDDMLNYQHALLEYGMLYHNFCDAVSEGDGQRIIRCWKFFLLFLKMDGQRSCKYALEGLTIMCQINAFLSPRDAHRLIWNRSVKAKSGMGGNIPLDLALEHYNRVLKEVIKKMGPNASNEKAVNRFCKAIGVTKQLMDNFDLDCQLLKRSGHHVAKKAIGDLKKVVEELVKCNAFTKNPNRRYKKFINVPPTMLENFDLTSMFKWINDHKKSIYLQKTAR